MLQFDKCPKLPNLKFRITTINISKEIQICSSKQNFCSTTNANSRANVRANIITTTKVINAISISTIPAKLKALPQLLRINISAADTNNANQQSTYR